MTAQSAYDIVTVLIAKATALQTYLGVTNGTDHTGIQADINTYSDQTYYGIPEVIIEDLGQATDLVALCLNKAKLVTDKQEPFTSFDSKL